MEKIAILAISLNRGGAEKVISLLLKELVNDYEVHLVLFDDVFHFDVPENVKIKILGNGDRGLRKIFNFPVFIKSYLKYLQGNNINTSVSFLTRPNIVNGIIKTLDSNIKVILSERCYPSLAYSSSKYRLKLYKTLIPIFYNKADKVFSNSKYINSDLVDNFGVKNMPDLLYNPIEEQAKIKLEYSIEKECKIVTVGSIKPIKNQQLLIEAGSEIKTNYQVSLIGDGPLMDELKKLSNEKGLSSKISFLGKRKDVLEQLPKFDVFALTSNSEGFPNVLVEAMSVGLPVIATNCMSGPLELLNDNLPVEIKEGEFYVAKYGILINIKDHIALSKAIDFLADNDDLREKLGKKALRRAADFYLPSIYNNFKKIINS